MHYKWWFLNAYAEFKFIVKGQLWIFSQQVHSKLIVLGISLYSQCYALKFKKNKYNLKNHIKKSYKK